MPKIIVLTVTYGNRWKFLSQVANAVISDPYVYKLVIVNNASDNTEEIVSFKKSYEDKVDLINNETNIGSAGGFSAGLEYIRNLSCDYVLLLDDDNVPSKNFKHLNNKKTVLLGNRINLQGSEKLFYGTEKISDKIPTTFFNVFSFKKAKYFFNLFVSDKKIIQSQKNFKQIVEVESFAYGGAFLPIQAIIDSPLPDPRLFTYGDDIEYSWGVRRMGYKIYYCFEPNILDIDLTFKESHILDMFSPTTSDFKIFFRMRNAALISKKSTKSKISVTINVFIWFSGLCVFCFYKLGFSQLNFKRAVLIFKALQRGLKSDFSIPNYIKVPNNTRKL